MNRVLAGSIRLGRPISILVLCSGALLSMSAWAGPIIGGKEWRQLTETVNLTWNEIDAICPNDGLSSCSGSIGAVDLTGWTWATPAQVRALFENSAIGVPAPATQLAEQDSAWAPAALALFNATFVSGTGAFRFGVQRDVTGFLPETITEGVGDVRLPGTGPVHAAIAFIQDLPGGGFSDVASTISTTGPDTLDT